jgi:regulatory protein YycH of two-component signal transduction system YycFG
LNEALQKKTYEFDALNKEKEIMKSTMTDKFNASLNEKTSYIREIEGKLADLTDGKRRAEEEAERYKTERDQR